MIFTEKFKQQLRKNKKSDDELYRIIAGEIDVGFFDQAAKMKAREKAKGDRNLSESLYIKYRMENLKVALEESISEVNRPHANEEATPETSKDGTQKDSKDETSGVALFAVSALFVVVTYALISEF